MDYAVDFVFDVNDTTGSVVAYQPSSAGSGQGGQGRMSFIYDDKRLCAKVYVFLKCIGITIYTTTLIACSKPELYFFLFMIITMFASTMNSARYEYHHFIRYNTPFGSLEEFNAWKSNLYPKSRMVFSLFELVLKVVYFFVIFPPKFELHSQCAVGQSVLTVHILAITIVYATAVIFYLCMACSFCYLGTGSLRRSRPLTALTPRRRRFFVPGRDGDGDVSENSETVAIARRFPMVRIEFNQIQTRYREDPQEVEAERANECELDCCICLDDTRLEPSEWSMLLCGHKFHSSCVSMWLSKHKTCPICRTAYDF